VNEEGDVEEEGKIEQQAARKIYERQKRRVSENDRDEHKRKKAALRATQTMRMTMMMTEGKGGRERECLERQISEDRGVHGCSSCPCVRVCVWMCVV
jgi:hypothetical protein